MSTEQPRLTYGDITVILDKLDLGKVLYGDTWKFLLLEKGDGFLLQLSYFEDDVVTHEQEEQKTRKWYLSSYSTKSEIVRTAYKLVMTSLEHRLGEHFLFEGRRVYNPHFDVDALQVLADNDELDVRLKIRP